MSFKYAYQRFRSDFTAMCSKHGIATSQCVNCKGRGVAQGIWQSDICYNCHGAGISIDIDAISIPENHLAMSFVRELQTKLFTVQNDANKLEASIRSTVSTVMDILVRDSRQPEAQQSVDQFGLKEEKKIAPGVYLQHITSKTKCGTCNGQGYSTGLFPPFTQQACISCNGFGSYDEGGNSHQIDKYLQSVIAELVVGYALREDYLTHFHAALRPLLDVNAGTEAAANILSTRTRNENRELSTENPVYPLNNRGPGGAFLVGD